MSLSLKVKEDGQLLEFLFESFKQWSKKKVRQYLKFGSILVNGQIRTQFDYALRPGDEVAVASEMKPLHQKMLKVAAIQPVYEDADLIVIDKPPGLLSIATAGTRTATLYYKLTDYVRANSGNPEARVFIVHRLDQDVSGLIVFAKNESTKHSFQDHWEEVEKKYYAIVEGSPREAAGEIRSYLTENASHRVYSTPNEREGKLAITRYRVLKKTARFTLLEIVLVTGRKNQIRVHLSEAGCPIVGDKKYDAQTKFGRRVYLHSFFLSFTHPATGKRLTFETKEPPSFKRLVP